mmetsp:Transcript_47234/g.111216  ORF Transcript_47234/g.111216 Transcript_47234/m.111216 type:complete len:212 (+) Transcript_47234:807-1442(+)
MTLPWSNCSPPALTRDTRHRHVTLLKISETASCSLTPMGCTWTMRQRWDSARPTCPCGDGCACRTQLPFRSQGHGQLYALQNQWIDSYSQCVTAHVQWLNQDCYWPLDSFSRIMGGVSARLVNLGPSDDTPDSDDPTDETWRITGLNSRHRNTLRWDSGLSTSAPAAMTGAPSAAAGKDEGDGVGPPPPAHATHASPQRKTSRLFSYKLDT